MNHYGRKHARSILVVDTEARLNAQQIMERAATVGDNDGNDVQQLHVRLSDDDVVEQVPEANVAASVGDDAFTVGEYVERRDDGGEWETGYVTSIDPLMVNSSDDNPNQKGCFWDEVRKL